MVTTFYQTGPNGLFIFYQVFNLILQSAENKYLLLSLFLLIELLMGMMSGQISATSNEAIYGESNKSTMLSTVSFIAEILVSLSLFVSNAIMKWAGNLKVMFFVSAAYFSIVLLIIPLIKQKEEL